MNRAVAILCGGLATRLGDITKDRPKCLVEVAGQPFIRHQLDWLASQKVRRVVLCTGKFSGQVEAELGKRYRSVELVYSQDGKQPLGTGGCLVKALPLLSSEFFVLNGDTFLSTELAGLVARLGTADGVVLINAPEKDWGNVCCDTDGLVLDYIPGRTPASWLNFVDCGLSLFKASAFEGFRALNCDLGSVFRALIKKRSLVGLKTKEKFYDMGTVDGLKQLEQKMHNENTPSDPHA
jgi:NDP-sugar pyrophosphorylase family protein